MLFVRVKCIYICQCESKQLYPQILPIFMHAKNQRPDESITLQEKLQLVIQTGLLLAKNVSLQEIVQAATEAGLKLCGAQFGAFFYNTVNAAGESYLLYTLAGADPEKFSHFPMPRNTKIFGPTFRGEGIVRSGDITQDPRYGLNDPYFGMPPGHLPVHSYLAVPVQSQTGEVLGGLFYGHADKNVFQKESENLVATVAAHAAIAIENFRLRESIESKSIAIAKIESLQNETIRNRNELAAIVDSSADAILSKDLDGKIVSWNHAAEVILGYKAEEIIGCSILTIIPPELHSEEAAILSKVRAGERIEHYETVRVTKAGERIDVSLSISPVRNGSGTIVGASKILRDISSRKKIEHSLIQAEKIAATGRMAATIAHEINNPLESVINLIYLARSNAHNSAKVEEYLKSAENEITRVSHIARQTLGFYRKHTFAIKTSIPSLVNQTLKIYKPKCDAIGIGIKTAFAQVPELTVRRGELMQAVSNIVTNSIYAMPDGGTLSVSIDPGTFESKHGIILSIADTGSGIPDANLHHVFEPFFTTRGTVGTGIGLWITKKLVEEHGGDISIESSTSPENHGTTVSIFLPWTEEVSAS